MDIRNRPRAPVVITVDTRHKVRAHRKRWLRRIGFWLSVIVIVSPAILVFLWMLSLSLKTEIDNITYPNRDLFDVANADDGEKLELARIGLIDLSVSELLEIRARARSAIEQALERERNPRKRARLEEMLRESELWRRTKAMAKVMLEWQRLSS